jgi:WD40 repeat protein
MSLTGWLAGCGAGLLNLGDSRARTPGEGWEPSRHELQAYSPGVTAIAFGPTSQQVFHGRMFATSHLPLHETDVRVSYARFPQARVTLWDEWGVQLFSLELPKEAWPPIRFSPDGKHMVFGTRDGIMFWNIENRSLERKFATGCLSYAISDDCRWIAISREFETPRRIRIFNVTDGDERCVLNAEGTIGIPYQFLDSNRRLGTTCWDSRRNQTEIIVWDLETCERVSEVRVEVPSLKMFAPDGSRFVAETKDHAIGFWDTLRGVLLFKTAPHSSHVRATAFSPDGLLLASAGEGVHRDKCVGEIKVWDATTGRELATILDESSWGVTALAFSPDGTELAAGNAEGRVEFRKVPSIAR